MESQIVYPLYSPEAVPASRHRSRSEAPASFLLIPVQIYPVVTIAARLLNPPDCTSLKFSYPDACKVAKRSSIRSRFCSMSIPSIHLCRISIKRSAVLFRLSRLTRPGPCTSQENPSCWRSPLLVLATIIGCFSCSRSVPMMEYSGIIRMIFGIISAVSGDS